MGVSPMKLINFGWNYTVENWKLSLIARVTLLIWDYKTWAINSNAWNMRQMAFPCWGMNVKYLMAFKVFCASIRLMRENKALSSERGRKRRQIHIFSTFLSASADLHHFKGTQIRFKSSPGINVSDAPYTSHFQPGMWPRKWNNIPWLYKLWPFPSDE